MAFRMQASVPDLTDISDEPDHVLDLYGPDAPHPRHLRPPTASSPAASPNATCDSSSSTTCGWDQHGDLPDHIRQAMQGYRPALRRPRCTDLKQRGMLDDTLVIWGGEFGRTVYSQGVITDSTYGRDHHPRCFSIWMAGGGIKPGITYGQTDDFGYNIVENPVHVNDLNATILQTIGLDHRLLSVKHQGLDVRLTGVEDHHPVKEILA